MSRITVPLKFDSRAPSPQNAVDIFAGSWVSDFAEACPEVRAGALPLFTMDTRPADAAGVLGVNGRFDGMRILELGPLEGGHTYQLEKLGAASILSIEGNAEAYLKCLITKEITGLAKTRFLYGDFTKYIISPVERYDLVFCSGVLYHMTDPIAVIRNIAKITDKCFVWTQYYDKDHYQGPKRRKRYDPRYPGVVLYVHDLGQLDMDSDNYLGGMHQQTVWLSREDLLAVFSEAGFVNLEIIEDNPDAEIGASITFAAWK